MQNFWGLKVGAWVGHREPVVGLSQQKSGNLTDIYTAGNVGAGILKRFNIIWGYPHSQIFFEKNKNYSAPDVFDRAGLWVNLSDAGFEIVDVIAGSPAAEAGLKVGDTVIAVNGMKAGSELTLPDFRLLLRGAPRTTLNLSILRAGQTLHPVIALRDLI